MKEPLPRTNEEITGIYQRHFETIYRVSYMFLKNVSDTEDAVQSVFMKLIQSAPAFANDEHEKAWLIVTAQNHCKNILKYWWKRKRSSLEQVSESSALLEQTSDETLESLLALPNKYKIVLYLFYYEGYSSKEIALLLGLKDSTLRSQLRNGRKRLRLNLIGGQCHEDRTIEQFH
ncbi:sigma-70 family RNA polymerase sigma factor [Paenibacillus sp. FSL F4-0125]|uniref:RNA polymerase sigma factor n=1 Tax=Paenibacillus sp. FSL F4-0125 TaxID=2954730 RepID=UPI0030F6F82E